jgi:large conductance mechanosensitive channel
MNFFREFRDFAIKGNVIDLAVAVVIGTAFNKIVSSLVADIVMPFVGVLMGGVHFESLSVRVGNAVVAYGKFIQSIMDFLILALCIFLAVRLIHHWRRKQESEPEKAPPPRDVQLLEEIRDLLKNRTKS